MYASLLNCPHKLFDPFERQRQELEDQSGRVDMPIGCRSVAPGTLPAIDAGDVAHTDL